MTEYQVRIYLQDEIPRLGCGWRTVTVREGRKWAYLTDCMGRHVRITLALLAQLKGA